MEKEIKMTRMKLIILLSLFMQYYTGIDGDKIYGCSKYEFQKRTQSLISEVYKLMYTHQKAAKAEGKYARRIKIKIQHPVLYEWLTKVKVFKRSPVYWKR